MARKREIAGERAVGPHRLAKLRDEGGGGGGDFSREEMRDWGRGVRG